MKPGRPQQWVSTSLVVGLILGCVTCFDYCTIPCRTKTQTFKHTMCLYPKETPGPLCKSLDSRKELKEEDKQLLLKLHNKLRSKVAQGKEARGSPGPQPQAANMMELVWDNELENIARRWALQCDYEHDKCRITKDKEYAGQNLAVSYESAGFQNDLEKMVNSWYDEVEHAPNRVAQTFSSSAGRNGETIGHYTQLVWGETSRLGCARLFFDFSDWGMTEYLVCNYGKGGNLRNAPIYEVGKQCSACGSGVKCSLTYPGLCGSYEEIKGNVDTSADGASDIFGTETPMEEAETTTQKVAVQQLNSAGEVSESSNEEFAKSAEDVQGSGSARGAVGVLEMFLYTVLLFLVVKLF